MHHALGSHIAIDHDGTGIAAVSLFKSDLFPPVKNEGRRDRSPSGIDYHVEHEGVAFE